MTRHTASKDGLRKLGAGMQAKDALDQSTKVQLSVQQFARRVGGPAIMSSHARLWSLKQQGNREPA